MKHNKTTTKNCFTSENFQTVSEMIDFRISVSGMGKFYVTYPKEANSVNDGIKRPPRNPDNVFDTYKEAFTGRIVLKSPKHHFLFEKETGLVDRQKVDQGLADELFCYLLNM